MREAGKHLVTATVFAWAFLSILVLSVPLVVLVANIVAGSVPHRSGNR